MPVALQAWLAWLTPRNTVVLFLLLVAVNLLAPFHADDYFQQLLLRGDSLLQRGGDGSLAGLFSFVDDNPQHRGQMQAYGVLPWFAAGDFYFRFWRPLAELSHLLDYRLLPGNAAFAHAHSIAWFLLLAAVVYRLARQTLGEDKKLLWLALAIFMLDGQHVATIHWIANRNALIAAVFSLAALSCHIHWRASGRWHCLPLALLLLAAGLLASESALAVGIYLFCYAVLLDRAGPRRGFASLLPYALLVTGWLLVYRQLDFGVGPAAGLYINPLHDPGAYLLAVLQRLPVYFAAALLPVPAGLSWGGGQWLSLLVVIISAVFMLAVLVAGRRVLASDRVLLFWFAGGVLSVLPVCSTLAQDRLALMQSVGMDLAIALLVYRLSWQPQRYAAMWLPFKSSLPALLLVIHLLLSPLHLLAGSWYMTLASHAIKDRALGLAANGELAGRHLLVLSMPIGEAVALLGIRRFYYYDLPASFLWLASDEQPLQWQQLADGRLQVHKPQGFASGHEAAFGEPCDGCFYPGRQIRSGAFVLQIEALQERRPASVLLTAPGNTLWLERYGQETLQPLN